MKDRSLEIFQEEFKKLHNKLDGLCGEVAEVRAGLVEVRGEVGGLHREVAEVCAGLVEVRGEVGGLRKKVGELRVVVNRNSLAIEEIRDELVFHRALLKEHSRSLRDVTRMLTELLEEPFVRHAELHEFARINDLVLVES